MATAYQPDLGLRAKELAQLLSQVRLASLMDVSRSTVTRWVKGEDVPTGANAAAILDLDFVCARYTLAFPASTFESWFESPNAFLNGASPRDVLHLEGPGRVVDALSSEIAGSYA